MYVFDSSLNQATSLGVSVNGNALTVRHLPEKYRMNDIMIVVKDSNGNDWIRRCYTSRTKDMTTDLKDLCNGTYSLNICFLMDGLYWPFFARHRPMIVKDDCKCRFTSSPFAVYNSLYLHSWPTHANFLKGQLTSCKQCQSNEREIVLCAESITRHHLFPYTKMMAIHDFVASHIAYDTDALKANKYLRNDNSALASLRQGRAICQGYTNLSIALLRSLGIPAMEVPCYALGGETEGGWECQQNKGTTTANHVLTAAYVSKRWIVMDITWDSDLEIVDGRLCEKTGCGVKHRYFDMTASMLSLTHRLIREAPLSE